MFVYVKLATNKKCITNHYVKPFYMYYCYVIHNVCICIIHITYSHLTLVFFFYLYKFQLITVFSSVT